MKAGNDLIANLSKVVRPQDDFNQFVNSEWLTHNKIPDDRSRWTTFDEIRDKTEKELIALISEIQNRPLETLTDDQRKVVAVYRGFLNQEKRDALGVLPLKEILDQIDSVKTESDLVACIAELYKRKVKLPFALYSEIDPKANTNKILMFGQSGLGLPEREYYLNNDEKYVKFRAAYSEYIAKIFELAGMIEVDGKVASIMKIEQCLAEAHWKQEDCRDDDKTYNKFPTQDLDKRFPGFPWEQFLSMCGYGSKDVIVRQPSAFEVISNALTQFSLEDWKTYLTFRLFNGFAKYLSEDFVKADFEFHDKILRGIPLIRAAEKRAVDAVNRVVGEPLSKVYATKYFPPEAKAQMLEMIKNLKAAFREGIRRLDWMGEESKAKAIRKLDDMRIKIGYPDKWQDFSELHVQEDALVQNIINHALFEFQKERKELSEPVDRERWAMFAHVVNAYNEPALNEICFPAGILQPPYFDMNAPQSQNYGAIGAIIGHEISHGFDDQGSKYDDTGNISDWWKKEERAEFERRTKVLVDQYDALEPLPGCHVNGRNTLGENIADVVGIKMALKAYQMACQQKPEESSEGYTPQQQLFFSWGRGWRVLIREEALREQLLTDPHAPAVARSHIPPQHSEDFQRIFNTKEGDGEYLAPEKQLKLW